MKYGLTRKLNVYNFESQMGEEVIATAGDYLQSQLWGKKNLKDIDGDLADLFQTYAWAWFALKRDGKLAEYGINAELTQETLIDMASTVSIQMESIPEDSLPLATQRKK